MRSRQVEKYLVLTCQDVKLRIRTPNTGKSKDKTIPEAEVHDASWTLSRDSVVLVSDHSIVMQIVFFNSSETDLSNDAI